MTLWNICESKVPDRNISSFTHPQTMKRLSYCLKDVYLAAILFSTDGRFILSNNVYKEIANELREEHWITNEDYDLIFNYISNKNHSLRFEESYPYTAVFKRLKKRVNDVCELISFGCLYQRDIPDSQNEYRRYCDRAYNKQYRKKNCERCGLKHHLIVDHQLELCDGGSDKPSNYQTLCRLCHSNKTRDFMKFKHNPSIH